MNKSFISLDNRTCQTCFKVFTRSDLRKRHEDTDSCQRKAVQKKQKPSQFKCDLCESVFKDKSSLKRHGKIHQENFKFHKCEECEKTFMNSQNKERHLTLVHNYLERNKNPNFPICRDSRKFLCDYCDGHSKPIIIAIVTKNQSTKGKSHLCANFAMNLFSEKTMLIDILKTTAKIIHIYL